ncbi:hypothetical protein NQZ68_013193 [Dissostichus eleginoides]|nr:hypothetical protein NQZ68_013193 [Dissostichus eleginoides]
MGKLNLPFDVGVGSSQTNHCVPNNEPQTHWTINMSFGGVFLRFCAGDTQTSALLKCFKPEHRSHSQESDVRWPACSTRCPPAVVAAEGSAE